MTKEQIKNIKVFLGRTELRGNEAPVLMDILRALEELEKDNKPKEKENGAKQ